MPPIDWNATGFSLESFICGILVTPAVFFFVLYAKASDQKKEGAWIFAFIASIFITIILVRIFNIPPGPQH